MTRNTLLGSCLALPLLACAADVQQHPSPPTAGEYDIAFPSTAVAVATDTVQVFVFDPASAGDCQALVQKKKSSQELPGALAQTSPTPICQLQGSTAPGIPNLTYGSRTFLAVTQRAGKDFFLGCATATINASTPPVSITLAPASATVVVPPTTCPSLSQKCANTCQ